MTTPQWVQDLVVGIRKDDFEKSRYEIQAELRDTGVRIGYNTIQKIINKQPVLKNVQHQKQIKQRRKLHIVRMKAEQHLRDKDLGYLVQIDTKHLYVS